ncbi:MAG TPA: osmotically inducible protein OsmC [Bacillales bacterium]|nr:osmotically inducible protein OsmC [Bacillales bacterium]
MIIPQVDATCDGGDLDCGSGLLLIIKKNIDPLPIGGILEIRSREASVEGDLPAWCRMVKHEFLGMANDEDSYKRYFVKKGNGKEERSLEADLEAAKGYKWTVRIQGEKGLTAKVHSRNHTFLVGQPAEFSPKVDAPSAVDFFISSLGSCLTVGFKMLASKNNITIDEFEVTLKGQLENVLYHMELEDIGSPKITKIAGTVYVSSPNEEDLLYQIWKKTLERSPIYQTLKDQVELDIKFSIVY